MGPLKALVTARPDGFRHPKAVWPRMLGAKRATRPDWDGQEAEPMSQT